MPNNKEPSISKIDTIESLRGNRRRLVPWYLFVYEKKTVNQIALETGIPLGTLSRWQHEGKWTATRDSPPLPKPDITADLQQFLTGKDPKPNTVLDPSRFGNSKMIDKWKAQASVHDKSYTLMREYGEHQLRILMERCLRLSANGDEEAVESDAMNLALAKSAGAWATIIDLCIKGERTISSAQYNDVNQAALLLEQYGYSVEPRNPAKSSDDEDTGAVKGISEATARTISENVLGVEI